MICNTLISFASTDQVLTNLDGTYPTLHSHILGISRHHRSVTGVMLNSENWLMSSKYCAFVFHLSSTIRAFEYCSALPWLIKHNDNLEYHHSVTAKYVNRTYWSVLTIPRNFRPILVLENADSAITVVLSRFIV